MSTMVTIIVAILGSGVLSTLITQLFAWRKEKNSEGTAVDKTCRLLLKTRLRELCEQYITQGWIYSDELDDLYSMHSLYHDELHGNGYLDTLMNKVKILEVRG